MKENTIKLGFSKAIQTIKSQFSTKDTDDFSEKFINFKWIDYILFYLWPCGKSKNKKNTINYAIKKI